jgi:parvulin-like peptidyl-prolyl isomerase
VLDLLVKGAEGKPRFTTRTWEDAKRECEQLAEKIQDEQSFLRTARIWSEDIAYKGRGGDRGFLHQEENGVDPSLTETAFALPLLQLSQPVRAADGYHLLMAVDERPAPPKERMLEHVREDLASQFLNRLVDAAEIEYLEP